MTDVPAADVPADATPAEPAAAPLESTPKKPGEWPEAPYAPASPQFPAQPGDRIRVFTNVAIFDLQARVEGELFDGAEVRAAADAGLIEILS